jgi:hypothetical protein
VHKSLISLATVAAFVLVLDVPEWRSQLSLTPSFQLTKTTPAAALFTVRTFSITPSRLEVPQRRLDWFGGRKIQFQETRRESGTRMIHLQVSGIDDRQNLWSPSASLVRKILLSQ